MSKHGMATYGKVPSFLKLSSMPDPKTEYNLTFANLKGGLNIYDQAYMLDTDESPDLINMYWVDGALSSRKGQEWYDNDETRGAGHQAFFTTWHDTAFFHIGTSLYMSRFETVVIDDQTYPITKLLTSLTGMYHGADSADQRGTFFRYGDYLYYKAPGLYVQIAYAETASDDWGNYFTATDMAANAYTPVTLINAAWQNGGGDSYQPENRIQSKKTIWYNAATEDVEIKFTATTSKTYVLTSVTQTQTPTHLMTDALDVKTVFVDQLMMTEFVDWTYDRDTKTLTLDKAPESGVTIAVTVTVAVKTYYLPVQDVSTTISKIEVLGSDWEWHTLTTGDYTFSAADGLVTLNDAAFVSFPFTNNTVRITYSLANSTAYNNIMDCPYAMVFGGSQNLCIVMGGCKTQSNAYFWNGNTATSMDPSYFPMDQYNLPGTSDPLTGFSVQQSVLLIFQTHSIGRAKMDTQTINDRIYITMDYTPINNLHGCDVPWTIQLVENNTVFCNTETGIHYVKDSTAAYENNVVDISKKVNGTPERPGILQRLGRVTPDAICSYDDGFRYWLVIGSDVYIWDYNVSRFDDPSYFYYEGVAPVAMIGKADEIYHLDAMGRITHMTDVRSDYDGPFLKRYAFPTQFFGSYDRLKNVNVAIFCIRSNSNVFVEITYGSDWEEGRKDLTNITALRYSFVPRNLEYRYLGFPRFPVTARRKPKCLHVRHFWMKIENNEVDADMGLVFAQILYNYQGRDR